MTTRSWRLSRWLAGMWLIATLGLAQPVQAAPLSIDFNDAEIHAVIKAMAEITGRNFLVDSRVKGRVSLVGPNPIDEKEAYQLFQAMLQSIGFTALDAGAVTKIVPVADAKQIDGPVGLDRRLGGQGDEMITQIVRLEYANAQMLVPVLRPLVNPNSVLVAYTPTNALIISDTAGNIRRLTKMIAGLDLPLSDALAELIPLKYASASNVQRMVKELFASGGGQGAAAQQQAIGQRLAIMADDRTNTLIVLGDEPQLRKVREMIATIDVPTAQTKSNIHLVTLSNADAEELSKILTQMLGSGAKPGDASQAPVTFNKAVNVVADKATNSLIITADPADFEVLAPVIEQLDVRRQQVFVEALIMEVSANKSREFGFEWQSMNGVNSSGVAAFGGTNFNNASSTGIRSVAGNITGLAGADGLAIGVAKGSITYGGNTFLNLGALVRALQTDADVNILSTPTLLTTDNQEAEIVVGQNVPFITGSYSTTGSTSTTTANPFQTVQRQDVGITLKLTPQISEGQFVHLDLYQEASSVAPSTTGAADLITNKRSVKTSVVVRDGQLVALGGLMQDNQTTTVKQVPCLGAIPLLGELFRYTVAGNSKTNLMVFLRPTIINSYDDLDRVSRLQFRRMDDVRVEQQYKGTWLFSPENPPKKLSDADLDAVFKGDVPMDEIENDAAKSPAPHPRETTPTQPQPHGGESGGQGG